MNKKKKKVVDLCLSPKKNHSALPQDHHDIPAYHLGQHTTTVCRGNFDHFKKKAARGRQKLAHFVPNLNNICQSSLSFSPASESL